MIKDDEFRDNPPNPDYARGPCRLFERLHAVYNADRPEVHRDRAGDAPCAGGVSGERLLIGEIYLPVERLVAYYGAELGGGASAVQLPADPERPGTPAAIDAADRTYEAALPPGGWPNWVLGNHDQRRIASRVGPAQARVAAMLLLTLRGTPTLYYGDELGMRERADPAGAGARSVRQRQPGTGQGRDPVRTPMQWDRSCNAGFTTGEPWLPLRRWPCALQRPGREVGPGTPCSR